MAGCQPWVGGGGRGAGWLAVSHWWGEEVEVPDGGNQGGGALVQPSKTRHGSDGVLLDEAGAVCPFVSGFRNTRK